MFKSLVTPVPKLPCVLPFNPAHIVLYISHLFNAHMSGATIQAKLSALYYVHNFHRLEDPCSHFLGAKTIMGVKKLSPAMHTRSPLTFHLLAAIISAIPPVLPLLLGHYLCSNAVPVLPQVFTPRGGHSLLTICCSPFF